MQMTSGLQLKRTASLSVPRSLGTFWIILLVLIYEVRNDMFHLKLLIENNLKAQKYPMHKNAITSKRFINPERSFHPKVDNHSMFQNPTNTSQSCKFLNKRVILPTLYKLGDFWRLSRHLYYMSCSKHFPANLNRYFKPFPNVTDVYAT